MTPQFADQRYFEDVAVGEQFEEEQQPTTEHVVSFVNTTGQPVGRGQPLFEVYSPELVSAQREYAIAADLREIMFAGHAILAELQPPPKK